MKRLLTPVSLAVICVAAALVGLLAYGLSSNEPDRKIEDALARGERKSAPKIELPKLTGRGRQSLADYRGKVVVLNFWASWCEPCREESPLLQRWHRRIAPDGGTVLGVDALDLTSDAREFIADYKLTYPMLRDRGGATRETFAIVGFPETLVIDRQGRIAAVRRGPVDEGFMRRSVPALLREKA